MSSPSRAAAHDRLAELVTALSGAIAPDDREQSDTIDLDAARHAIDLATQRHGDNADRLLTVADALVALRSGG